METTGPSIAVYVHEVLVLVRFVETLKTEGPGRNGEGGDKRRSKSFSHNAHVVFLITLLGQESAHHSRSEIDNLLHNFTSLIVTLNRNARE